MRVAILALLVGVGCDSVAGTDYVGEPLFTLVGGFAPTSAQPSLPVGGVALLWQDADGAGGPGKAATAVPVTIEFPASFRVAVPTPPPLSVMFTFGDGGPAIAEAYVYVIADVAATHPIRVLGADRGHAVIYAAGDVAADSAAARYLGGPVAAGFHLREYMAVSPPAAGQLELIARCVASGAPRVACETRRSYQLAAARDSEELRIVLWPP